MTGRKIPPIVAYAVVYPGPMRCYQGGQYALFIERETAQQRAIGVSGAELLVLAEVPQEAIDEAVANERASLLKKFDGYVPAADASSMAWRIRELEAIQASGDHLSLCDIRQHISEEIPGFFVTLAKAMNVSPRELVDIGEQTHISKTDTIKALGRFAIDQAANISALEEEVRVLRGEYLSHPKRDGDQADPPAFPPVATDWFGKPWQPLPVRRPELLPVPEVTVITDPAVIAAAFAADALAESEGGEV